MFWILVLNPLIFSHFQFSCEFDLSYFCFVVPSYIFVRKQVPVELYSSATRRMERKRLRLNNVYFIIPLNCILVVSQLVTSRDFLTVAFTFFLHIPSHFVLINNQANSDFGWPDYGAQQDSIVEAQSPSLDQRRGARGRSRLSGFHHHHGIRVQVRFFVRAFYWSRCWSFLPRHGGALSPCFPTVVPNWNVEIGSWQSPLYRHLRVECGVELNICHVQFYHRVRSSSFLLSKMFFFSGANLHFFLVVTIYLSNKKQAQHRHIRNEGRPRAVNRSPAIFF